MVGKQNILLRVASENKEVRDVDIDFILNHCSHSALVFALEGRITALILKGQIL